MANDYRYFPEPDLPPLELSEEWIQQLKSELPELPEQRIKRYSEEFSLSHYDASLLTSDKTVADFFEQLVTQTPHYKAAANWINGPLQSYVNENGKDFSVLQPFSTQIAEVIALVESSKINNSAAVQQLFPALVSGTGKSVSQLVQELNLMIDTDDSGLIGFIEEAVGKYPGKVSEYHKGKKGVLGLFMGEIMKISKGKIDPKTANKLLIEKLESLK
jgi:aspartyl-tRNA(Asn)/glutamyl-tRNA(Gln) amidotransferase subunit B